jgi:YtcA family
VTERHTKRHLASCNTHYNGRRVRCVRKVASALLLMCTMCGCSDSPSRNILGSYFPSWMICALGGLAVALAARVALKATGLLAELPAPLVVLLSIGCATTFTLWLLWLA